MDVSIMIEGQMGVTWPRWKNIVAAVEDLGFAGLFRSDHFSNSHGPLDDALELIVSLTYAAEHSKRIHFGSLVAPVSFRDPVMLARQAAALADLSGSRMVLGIGAGWQDREHQMFGYDLLGEDARFARFQEGLEVATRLIRSIEPVTFKGAYFRLTGAELKPRARVPILVGGSGVKRTLPLAARYADWWNGIFLAPDAFRERCKRLDELLEEAGRKLKDVRRTMMTGVYIGNEDEALRARGALAGSLDQIKVQLADLADAGCEEVMVQWLALDDLDALQDFARAVLPG